jgi:hypothetical protein
MRLGDILFRVYKWPSEALTDAYASGEAWSEGYVDSKPRSSQVASPFLLPLRLLSYLPCEAGTPASTTRPAAGVSPHCTATQLLPHA